MHRVCSLFLLFTFCLSASGLIGVGGFDVKKSGNYYVFHDKNTSLPTTNITEVVSQYSPNVNAISIWITKEWKDSWYPIETVQKEIIDKGYTPVFIFYWFGDEISLKYIKKNRHNYFKTLRKFTQYLKQLHGQKIVVLNPEYNMFGVEKWEGMNEIFLKSFKILREDPQVLVGPCVGDFGNYGLVDEPKEWKLFDKSLHKAAKASDFIAFQEMRALTRNKEKEILNTPERAFYFSKYLYNTYHKPTLLAYLAISTYRDKGKKIQAEVYKQFIPLISRMQEEANLLYFGIFHYFDYPGHVGYFNAAEEYFGVLEANGTRKPSLKYFNRLK